MAFIAWEMAKQASLSKDSSSRGLVDDGVVQIVADNFDQLKTYVNERQEAARDFYEKCHTAALRHRLGKEERIAERMLAQLDGG